MSDYTKLSRKDLINICKEKQIKGYSTKTKADIITLLQESTTTSLTTASAPVTSSTKEKIQRLNYIGSKYQLLDWLTTTIKEKTGYTSFNDKTIADLFGGTGVVSYHFRNLGATLLSNDAELFSSIITSAFTNSTYTQVCKELIDTLNLELQTEKKIGTITQNYSPYGEEKRQFFTEDNAQKIDHVRQRLEDLKPTLSTQDYTFMMASLLVSADAISNVPAVYGCYLKNFKAKAKKPFLLAPIHTNTTPPSPSSKTYNSDVLNEEFLTKIKADIVYLDPPYNERQYSKNYFPLNIIAKSPNDQSITLKGKTGIPSDCFLSPFCKKGKPVEEAFDRIFKTTKADWIFLSYNSESLVSKNRMIEIMEKYGDVSVVERDYKRFKSFEYNEDKDIKEYLFCLHKTKL
jgi:adenine-specific DNA-methyltransferase